MLIEAFCWFVGHPVCRKGNRPPLCAFQPRIARIQLGNRLRGGFQRNWENWQKYRVNLLVGLTASAAIAGMRASTHGPDATQILNALVE
jgi:hypothetical protein